MELPNVVQMQSYPPDSQFRLKACGCGNDQPVYLQKTDGKWAVHCLECGAESEHFAIQHDAQQDWNGRWS